MFAADLKADRFEHPKRRAVTRLRHNGWLVDAGACDIYTPAGAVISPWLRYHSHTIYQTLPIYLRHVR